MYGASFFSPSSSRSELSTTPRLRTPRDGPTTITLDHGRLTYVRPSVTRVAPPYVAAAWRSDRVLSWALSCALASRGPASCFRSGGRYLGPALMTACTALRKCVELATLKAMPQP